MLKLSSRCYGDHGRESIFRAHQIRCHLRAIVRCGYLRGIATSQSAVARGVEHTVNSEGSAVLANPEQSVGHVQTVRVGRGSLPTRPTTALRLGAVRTGRCEGRFDGLDRLRIASPRTPKELAFQPTKCAQTPSLRPMQRKAKGDRLADVGLCGLLGFEAGVAVGQCHASLERASHCVGTPMALVGLSTCAPRTERGYAAHSDCLDIMRNCRSFEFYVRRLALQYLWQYRGGAFSCVPKNRQARHHSA